MAAEFALVAVDRDRIEVLAAQGNRRARLALRGLERLSFNLSGAQLGITASSLVLGFVAEPAVAVLLDPLIGALPFVPEQASLGVSIALALGLATVVQMVLGELVPKNWAIARPLGASLLVAAPLRAYTLVAGPLIALFNAAANATCRRLGIEPREELTSVRTLQELELLVQSSGREGTLDPESLALLTRTFRFAHKTADEAMVPRVSVTAIRPEQSVAELAALAVETGYSRFPVYRDELDDIVGVVLAKDVFRVPAAERSSTPVARIMKDALAIPETRDLESLLVDMRSRGTQLAVVVDEYGGTAGIITLEDVLEEIVGEIHDEHDPVPEAGLTAALPAGTWVLDGTLHLDEVLDLTGLEIPDGDYETLAGFVLALLGRIPEEGEQAAWQGWTLEVLARDRLRIATVRVTAPPATAAGPPDGHRRRGGDER